MSKIKFYIMLISITIFYNLSNAQNINFRYLGLKEGLSQMSVVSIWSDENDIMWFATRRGINSYDGNTIIPLKMTTKDGRVEHFDRPRFICGNRNGIIYFLSDEELVQYNLKYNQFKSLGKNISTIAHQKNTLWASRNQTVFYLDKQNNYLKPFLNLKSILKSKINTILQSTSGKLYIGSDNGLITVSRRRKKVNVYLSGVNINTFFEDHEKNIWVGTKFGLYVLDSKNKISHYTKTDTNSNSLLSDDIRAITQDKKGNIWIGTSAGINKFDLKNKKIDSYTTNENKKNSLSQNSVYSMFCDKQGTIWIGTYYGGINYFNQKNDVFKYPFDDIAKFRRSYSIDKICPISMDEVFISSSSLGTFRYNIKNNTLKSISQKKIHILSHFYDKKSNLIYFGTINQGIVIYDILKNSFLPAGINIVNSKLPSSTIVGISKFKDNLYIATPKGYISYNLSNHSSKSAFSQITKSISVPSQIMIDSKQRLWMLSLDSEIIKFDLKNKKYEIHNELQPTKPLEQSIRINNIFEDTNHRIWIATSGKGIYQFNESKSKFEIFANNLSGLRSNYCFDIKEGNKGELICFENDGITYIDVNKKRFDHLSGERFLSDKIMNEGLGYYADKMGNILVGTMQGLVAFNNELVTKNIPISNIFFSRLFINSEEILPNDKSEILTESLPYTSSIALSTKNKSFDIEFSIPNYLKVGKLNIEYILEGFDKKWIKINTNKIHYTNLSPGEYSLKVRIENEKNKYKEIVLPITINSEFYNSKLAYFIYFILIIIIVIYIIRFLNWKQKILLSLDYEQREKKRIEELNQSKLKFYINISHEFRTPISLIIAQIELLLSNHPELNTHIKKAIQRIHNNANKFQNLVTEVLDYRKQDSEDIKINFSMVNLIELLTDIVDSFQESSQLYSIKLNFNYSVNEIFIYIDRSQFSKAIYNLISNSFKFTRQGGEINITCHNIQNKIKITVSDNGIGIPEEDLSNIFELYFQSSNSTKKEGFGIGLSYVKEIVEYHGGIICVKNHDNSNGCIFTIELDIKKTSDLVLNNNFENTNLLNTTHDLIANLSEDTIQNENTILIVEDNIEMLNLLIEIFRPLYNVHIAKDGSEALNTLKSINPDIILSDVMMSKISGIELCKQIKNNYETCHIPIVLLTAQSLEIANIEGLQSGADDYIVKPFNVKLLIMRCNNLINMRRVLQDKFAKLAEFSPKIVATNPNDIKFIEKAHEVIESNFENQNFDVDKFCKEMGMSRVKLYNKMKGVTGLTPKDFIQNIKLKKASELLIKRPDLLISEITYKLGFSSPRYFSKCFKDLFGIIPSEYREKNTLT
jgi:signal transduction histidine kinase/DNA-binding response OmpR family regulator/ligand-binding sensor domain-containing protein